MKDFDLVKEYLAEHGYTLMHSNPDKTWGNFAALDGNTSIEIVFKDGEFKANACGFLPKSMIQLIIRDFSIPNKALFFNLNKIEKAISLYSENQI